MTAQDLRAIQEMMQPQFESLGKKIDQAMAGFEKANDGNRESIRQLYEENKEIRANMASADTELRKEITASASSLRDDIGDHETRITGLQEWKNGQKESKTNWIALAGVLLMGIIFVADKIMSAFVGKST